MIEITRKTERSSLDKKNNNLLGIFLKPLVNTEFTYDFIICCYLFLLGSSSKYQTNFSEM